MIPDHVDRLHLHIRSAYPVAEAITAAAQRFTETVLAQTAANLRRATPSRFVFVRHLKINWRLPNRILSQPTAASRFAQDIIARLESQLPVGLPIAGPDKSRDVVVFADEAHWRAAHAIACATQHHADAWFFKTLQTESEPLAALCQPDRHDLAWQVMTCLARADLLTAVAAATSTDTAAALTAVLFPGDAALETAVADSSLIADFLTMAGNGLADMTFEALALVFFGHARIASHASRPTIAASVAEALSRLNRTYDTGSELPQAERSDPAGRSQEEGPPPDAVALQQTGVNNPSEAHPDVEDHSTESNVETRATQAAGLFYLLNLSLELNIGEILWKACLPESLVLAHAAALLLGPALRSDPAVALFAGETPRDPFPEVSIEQQVEVSAALLRQLVAALPRRGLAKYPHTHMRLAPSGDQRLLIVSPQDSLSAVFIRCAASSEDVQAAVAEFIDRWPRSATPPRASGALAHLDPTTRIIPDDTLCKRSDIEPQATIPTPLFAVLLQIIGVLRHLFEARLSEAISTTTADFAAAHLTLPGNAVLAPEAMTVVFGEDQIDLDLRRVGLDRNPGWVPWINRSVVFRFDPESGE